MGDLNDDPLRGRFESALETPSLLGSIWRRWRLVLATVIASLVIGIVYLKIATPTYSIELKVTAAASTTNSIASRLGSLGGLAAAAGLGISSSSKAEPFDLYLEALTSRDVANQLARDPHIMRTIFAKEWDADHNSWAQPSRPVAQVAKSVLGLNNQPWHQPDGARLRDYLQREVVITKSNKSPVTQIGYDAKDPDFGVYLLSRMNNLADYQVRTGALQQATEYQAYLTGVLPTVALAEVRRSLADTLTQQYESVMMAKSKVAYAAMALGEPQASTVPTKPKALIVIMLSAVLGLILGCLLAANNLRDIIARARVASDFKQTASVDGI